MSGDLTSTTRVMAAVSRARDTLLSFAGNVWSIGAHEYFLVGRHSRFHTTQASVMECGMLVGETIVLDDNRTLDMDINIHFIPTGIVLSGGIIVSIETSEGFDEEEILELPRVQVDSSGEFISVLDNFVTRICAHPDVLDGVAVRRS